MNKIILILLFTTVTMFANKSYELSSEEYLKYKQNPSKMERQFKDKFILMKTKKTKVKKVLKTKVAKKKKVVKKRVLQKKKIVKKEIVKKKTIRKKRIVTVKKEKIKITNNKIVKKRISKSYKKDTIVNRQATSPKKESFAFKSVHKLNIYYTIAQVNNKLKYDKITNNKNILLLTNSIKELFKDSKNNYEIKEILLVVNQIHNKKISSFEADVYLKQIKQLLRDIN